MILDTQKDPAIITELCNCFYYEYSPAGRIIFREGDTQNTNFYFVLEGSVGVYISSMIKAPAKKEMADLEQAGWNPETVEDKKMIDHDTLLTDYGFPPDDISVYLPKCKINIIMVMIFVLFLNVFKKLF
jgi:hypothetical protein